jgi:cardiolipin synthase
MQIEILVDQEEYWPRLEADIASARNHVYVQTLSFEGDRVGKAIAQCMLDCPAPDRRLIADDVHVHHRINDKYLHSLKHRRNMDIRRERDETLRIIATLEGTGVRVLLTNRAGPFTLNSFQRNHKKMIVVDDRVAYIGGVNFSEHNFEWHDMMLRIESPEVAALFKADFRSTWAGSHRAGAHDFDGLTIHLMDGHTNRAAFRPILELIASARESVYEHAAPGRTSRWLHRSSTIGVRCRSTQFGSRSAAVLM